MSEPNSPGIRPIEMAHVNYHSNKGNVRGPRSFFIIFPINIGISDLCQMPPEPADQTDSQPLKCRGAGQTDSEPAKCRGAHDLEHLYSLRPDLGAFGPLWWHLAVPSVGAACLRFAVQSG